MRAKHLITLLTGLGLMLYPLLVYSGLGYWGAESLAMVLLVLAALRLAASRWWGVPTGNSTVLMLAVALVAAVTLASGSVMSLKAYPVIINSFMLALFALSLWRPPSMVERFARLREPDLPASAIPYTRKVTMVWCGFFLLNGSIATATLFASDRVWAIYNGLLAYVFMGLLFAGEYWVRQRVRQKRQE